VVVEFAERIAALRLFAPHYWIALEDEGVALGVESNSGKRTLCLFKSREDAEEVVVGAGVEGRYTIREMITVGDMAALFGSPNGQTYTHIAVNLPPGGSAFNVEEKDAYLDQVVEMSGGPAPQR
jgi:hypothetical protein